MRARPSKEGTQESCRLHHQQRSQIAIICTNHSRDDGAKIPSQDRAKKISMMMFNRSLRSSSIMLLLLSAVVLMGATDIRTEEDDATATCPQILVTYYSFSVDQWTSKLASEVATGATDAGANVRLRRTNETSCDDMLWADGIALGSPVYWAGLSSQAKAFLEAVQSDCFGWPVTQLLNKVGGAFATGGQLDNGKDATMGEILTAWRAMHMVTVGCDCGSNCTCNPWGASATNLDSSERKTLSDSEVRNFCIEVLLLMNYDFVVELP
jgi:NAD(P)H dehydrogenase (quinone)